MYYAIDDNLLSRLKQLAATNSNSTDLVEALTSAESNPLITCLIWTRADVVAASRKLIQGDNPRNAVGSWFRCEDPFSDPIREQLAQEIASGPDEFCLGIRDEVDSAIYQGVIEIVRDVIRGELEEHGSERDSHTGSLEDWEIENLFPRLPEQIVAEGLAACAREIAALAARELV